jgi:hypothetical protein
MNEVLVLISISSADEASGKVENKHHSVPRCHKAIRPPSLTFAAHALGSAPAAGAADDALVVGHGDDNPNNG